MSESSSSSITSRVVAGVLLAAVLWGATFIPGLFAWLSIKAGLLSTHLGYPSELPNWGVYLLVITSVPSLMLLINAIKKDKGQSITEYTQDHFWGLNWRWSYIGDQPHDPWAFCNTCDTCLVYLESGVYKQKAISLHCETCESKLLEQDGDKQYLIDKVHRQIDRKIRTGEWINVIAKFKHNQSLNPTA